MSLMKFTGTALKNLFSPPSTKNYPAESAVYTERTRGHIEYSEDLCIMCTLCGMKCPTGAIKVDRASGTWSINRFDCVQCGYCTTVCAKGALKIVPGYQEPMGEKNAEIHHKEMPPKPAAPAAPAQPAKKEEADAK